MPTDLVVTVPRRLWSAWLAEGDLPGQPETGEEWAFFTHRPPSSAVGGRLYIVAYGRLRGYAPITRIAKNAICRRGGAVAITIPEAIYGFRGWRRRWWNQAVEMPFPEWEFASPVPPNSIHAVSRRGAK